MWRRAGRIHWLYWIPKLPRQLPGQHRLHLDHHPSPQTQNPRRGTWDLPSHWRRVWGLFGHAEELWVLQGCDLLLNALAQQGDCEYTCEEMGGGAALMGSLGLSFISWGSNKPLQRSLEVSLLFPQLCPIQWRLMRRARRTSDPSPSPPAQRNSGSSSTPMKETVEKASKCLMWRMMVRTELLTFYIEW